AKDSATMNAASRTAIQTNCERLAAPCLNARAAVDEASIPLTVKQLWACCRHYRRPVGKMPTGSVPPLVNQRSDQRRPAGLVARPDARAVVAVKVLVEQHVVAPVRIFLKFLRAAVDRAAARFVARENLDHAIGRHLGHL